jgi:hypothetical protein
MIWYVSAPLAIGNMPQGHYAEIVGRLKDMLVTIEVEYHTPEHRSNIIEFLKTLGTVQYDINYDDIRMKYWNKVIKIFNKHDRMTFQEWYKYFNSKNPKTL